MTYPDGTGEKYWTVIGLRILLLPDVLPDVLPDLSVGIADAVDTHTAATKNDTTSIAISRDPNFLFIDLPPNLYLRKHNCKELIIAHLYSYAIFTMGHSLPPLGIAPRKHLCRYL